MREPIQSYLLIKTHPLDVNMALGIDYLVRCDLSVGVSLRQWMKWHDWCWKHSRGTACEALRPRQRHGLVVYIGYSGGHGLRGFTPTPEARLGWHCATPEAE